MNTKQRRILLGLILVGWVSPVGAALRIATYNIALGEIRPGLDTVLRGLCEQEYQGIRQPLDILILQEQDSVQSTTQEIVTILNRVTDGPDYHRSEKNGTGSGGTMAVVYNANTVVLLDEKVIAPPSYNDRSAIRYHFKLAGYSIADSHFYIYVAHLKATTQPSSEQRRAAHAAQIRQDADRLGAGANVIFAGDLNIYTSAEAAYQNLVAPGPAQAYDPIGVSDWQGSSNRRWHTQAPAVNPADSSLVGGGMDDRFDFQLFSTGLHDGKGLDWIDGSYRTFGNNGTHTYNRDISTGSGASREILNALKTASDHCPVVVEYQHPARMSINAPDINGQVLARGYQYKLKVSNAAPTQPGTDGAAPLNYQIATNLTGRQPEPLPDNWTLKRIGTDISVAIAKYYADPEGFSLTGAGAVTSTADNFAYIYQALTGDGSLELKVSAVQSDSAGAAGGLMIRQSLADNAPFGYIYLTRDFGLKWRKRMTTGSLAFVSNGPADVTSAWLRISRVGQEIRSAWSLDRQNWTSWLTAPISSLPDTVYIGMAVASYAPDSQATVNFDTEEVASTGTQDTVYTARADAGPVNHSLLIGRGTTGSALLDLNITSVDTDVEDGSFHRIYSYRYADYQDFDDDCDFDRDDLNLLLRHLGQPDSLYDLDQSGTVDAQDLDILLNTILARPAGDLNLDGQVAQDDLNLFIQNFNQSIWGWEHGEITGDGKVDLRDFSIITQNWLVN